MPRLAPCRRGTAAIEFALVAPMLVLLVVGLADNVRRTLARIDLDAASHAGARAALAGRPVEPAVAAIASGLDPVVTTIDCSGRLGLAGGCTALPPGRYVAVSLSDDIGSLFGAGVDGQIESTALVRLP